MLGEVVYDADMYVSHVCTLEARRKMSEEAIKRGEHKGLERLAEGDTKQKRLHNTLINSLEELRVYLNNEHEGYVPEEGLFTYDIDQIHDRIVIGNWAGDLIIGLAERGDIERPENMNLYEKCVVSEREQRQAIKNYKKS
jgi:hypothetical protein